MITINIFGLDAIIGDFQLSNYGLVLASFESSHSSDEELGMDSDTVEEYIGHNPVPVYLDAPFVPSYASPLRLSRIQIPSTAIKINILPNTNAVKF